MDGLSRPFTLLPPEAPLAMPEQRLDQAPAAAPKPPGPAGTRRWRAFVFGLTLALAIGATSEMWQVLGLARWTVSGAVMTLLFAVLILPIALSFSTALAGFVLLLRSAPAAPRATGPSPRTALLMPIYNEAVAGIAARLGVMREALHAAGASDRFDIFVLSDTRDRALRAAEADAVLRLRAEPGCAVFYRSREDNAGRKAGNIAEWVRRFGGAYEMFLILDADSVMEAETLTTLVVAMQSDPRLGLLQTVPVLRGGRTLFARLQDFASQVHGPLLATGGAAWHGAEGNYWGHNALIRTRAFAETCGLPSLPGRRPFGGDIMSHDFVEAALLRRAGWGVRMLPRLGGSYEGGPPTLPEMDKRDRRWCQGNLQHAAVIGAAGLHPISRLHMALGIAGYIASPLWLAYLLIGIAVSVQARFLRPEYFPSSHVLFPQWPVVDAERAIWVFGATIALLLTPKLLGLVAFAIGASRPRGMRGWLAFLGWAMAEILVSALLSPVAMLGQARHVLGALRGRDSGWSGQVRDGANPGFADAWRFSRGAVMLGLVFLALTLAVNPDLTLWMSPVILGLLMAPAMVWLTAREWPIRAGRS
jgi:membrane glycosyltransferase